MDIHTEFKQNQTASNFSFDTTAATATTTTTMAMDVLVVVRTIHTLFACTSAPSYSVFILFSLFFLFMWFVKFNMELYTSVYFVEQLNDVPARRYKRIKYMKSIASGYGLVHSVYSSILCCIYNNVGNVVRRAGEFSSDDAKCEE